MEAYFNALKELKSSKEALSALKTSLLKKKLQIKQDLDDKENINENFKEILCLMNKKDILDKLLKKQASQ